MKDAYLQALKTRASIGGLLTPADQLILLKDLMIRMDTIEGKLNETAKTRTRNSKVSKRNASAD